MKEQLPAAAPGSVDLVTFSYSLSMIPDKTAALNQANPSTLSPRMYLLASFRKSTPP